MSVQRFGSDGPWEDAYGYSRVVRFGDVLITSGCTSTVEGRVAHVGQPYAQALEAFGIGMEALEAAGAGVADVVRTRMYVTDRGHSDAVGRAHGVLFGAVRPATTLVVVAGLLHPHHLVEVEIEAYLGGRASAVPTGAPAATVPSALPSPLPSPGPAAGPAPARAPVPRHHDLFSPYVDPS